MAVPTVTVLMPVLNCEAFVADAVESILNQTFEEYEFLIINDGSTDRTAEIIKGYQKKDPRIIFLDRTNKGLVDTLNLGLKIARGEFIARMDADDISLPKRLELQVNRMEADAAIGVVGCATRIWDVENNSQYTWKYPIKDHLIRWSLFFECPFAHPAVLMRRNLILEMGGYRAINHAEDYDLWQRLSCVTRFDNLSDELVILRRHGGNVSVRNAKEQRENSIAICVHMLESLVEHSVGIEAVIPFWLSEFSDETRVFEAARLIVDAYNAFRKKNKNLDRQEQTEVRTNASLRIFRLSLQHRQYVCFWGLVRLALLLDPVVFFRLSTVEYFKQKLINKPILR